MTIFVQVACWQSFHHGQGDNMNSIDIVGAVWIGATAAMVAVESGIAWRRAVLAERRQALRSEVIRALPVYELGDVTQELSAETVQAFRRMYTGGK